MRLKRQPAFFTHEDSGVGHLYYFAPENRAEAPYLRQRTVSAIIDIAEDGTLAGVELIDDMPPPPTSGQSADQDEGDNEI